MIAAETWTFSDLKRPVSAAAPNAHDGHVMVMVMWSKRSAVYAV